MAIQSEKLKATPAQPTQSAGLAQLRNECTERREALES